MCCDLCGRAEVDVTRHHLIPRARHRRGNTHRQFDREEMTGRIAMLCRPCHKFIHGALSERELAENFNTVPKLLSHPAIARFVHWIATKPAGLSIRSDKMRQRLR